MPLSLGNATPSRRWPLAVGGLLLLAPLLVWAADRWWWRRPDPPPERSGADVPPDPRLTYNGPFQNIHPDVKYVGDAACAGCHPLEAATFREHPMGRSLVPAARAAADPLYDRPAVVDAFHARLSLERRDGRLWETGRLLGHKGEPLAQTQREVHYVIGSGQRGHSYLTARDGFLFQTPFSWFAQQKKWDGAPGFVAPSLREIGPACLFCHSGGALPVPGSVNRYETPLSAIPSIGCERCHGPGERHVASRGREELPKTPFDPTIVNPRRLEPALREQVCQQCHLSAAARIPRRGRHLFEYRPGLPLDAFWSAYVFAGQHEGDKAVSQVEQMYQSACFRASSGRMGCVSCHDPHQHVRPEERVAHYRARCLACHEGRPGEAGGPRCALDEAARRRQDARDSCVDCHMPRFAAKDIAHTAVTDHRVPRRPGVTRHRPPEPALPGIPLVHFHRGPARPEDGESRRELGLALLDAASEVRPSPGQLVTALELLDRAAEEFPRDVPLLVGLGECLKLLRRDERALGTYEAVLALEPRQEIALRRAAALSLQFDQVDKALEYCRRSLELNPLSATNHLTHALVLLRKRDWAGAVRASRAALRFDPSVVTGHVILSRCYERMGDRAAAAGAMEKARAMPGQNVDGVEKSLESYFR